VWFLHGAVGVVAVFILQRGNLTRTPFSTQKSNEHIHFLPRLKLIVALKL